MIRVFITLFLAIVLLPQQANALLVTHQRTEYLKNPIGVAFDAPRVSWMLNSDKTNTLQIAYELVVMVEGQEVWNSGKVASDQSHLVSLPGLKLKSKTRYFWKVKVWDNHGQISEYSPFAYFETGFLSKKEWKAQWITVPWEEVSRGQNPVQYFRKEIDLKRDVKWARLYITSHGLYEAYLNGQKVGTQEMTPGWTSYKTRLQYQVYDVKDHVQKGANAIGAMVADGWHRGRINYRGMVDPFKEQLSLLVQLEVVYDNGKKEVFVSDKNWKASTGGLQKATIYDGVEFDATLEPEGWKEPGFDVGKWEKVLVREMGFDHLVPSHAPPVRVVKTVQSIASFPKGPEEVIFDFGQNLVGRVVLVVESETPTTVVIEHGEILDPNGRLYTENLRGAKARVSVKVPGGVRYEYIPNFTFMGFRYIRVTGVSRFRIRMVTAQVLSSELERTGTFQCSNEQVNKLYENVIWSQRGNFLDVPTDCPQRDERMGWTGDAQVFFPTAALNMDVAAFFRKWLCDLKADQYDDGGLPWVIPDVFARERNVATGWADAATIIPWKFYEIYGDERLLQEQYASMKAWVEYMVQNSENGLWFGKEHFGDWLSYFPEQKPHTRAAVTEDQLLAQIFYQYSLGIMIKTADVLDDKEDLKRYQNLWREANEAFYKEFVTPNGRLVSGTQTAYVLVLEFELLDIDDRAQAARRLVENIKTYGHISTGFLGTPHICHVLSDFGYTDQAYGLLLNKNYPSWLYTVQNGGTTIWERWDGIKTDGTLQNPRVNSFNHYAYGAIGSWLVERAGGIQRNPKYPGYKEFIIAPEMSDSLDFMRASFQCNYGKIESFWTCDSKSPLMGFEIPANTKAEIKTPRGYRIVQVSSSHNGKLTPINFFKEIGPSFTLGSGQYILELERLAVD